MNLLLSKNFVVHYWQISLGVLIIFLSLLYFYSKKKSQHKINNSVLLEKKYKKVDFTFDEEITSSLENKEHITFKGATVTLNGGAQKFYEIVNDRRSVRMFSAKSIDFSIIKKCIQAAGTAPSGAHTEPWTFCAVSNSAIKQQIRDIIETEEDYNYSQRMSQQWKADLVPLRTNQYKKYLTDAPYLILIFKQTYGVRKDGKKKQHYYNEISVSIATGILLCALQCSGLNSLVTTPLNCGPALRELLNRPINEKLHVLIPVGIAANNCKVPDLQRKSLDDILVKY